MDLFIESQIGRHQLRHLYSFTDYYKLCRGLAQKHIGAVSLYLGGWDKNDILL
jgi:hypothetical protein